MLFILDSSRIQHSLPLEPFFTACTGRYFFHLLTRLSLVRGKQLPAVRTVGIVTLSINTVPTMASIHMCSMVVYLVISCVLFLV